jgi:hypothetical protein
LFFQGSLARAELKDAGLSKDISKHPITFLYVPPNVGGPGMQFRPIRCRAGRTERKQTERHQLSTSENEPKRLKEDTSSLVSKTEAASQRKRLEERR